MSLLQTGSQYLSAYGYYFLFLAAVLENVPFVGLFMPGEVIVVAAGFFAARGELRLLMVIVVAVVGGIMGNNFGYWLGYYGGRPLIERLAKRFHVDHGHLKYAEEYFENHGSKTVFFGRYMAGIKAFITALAGASRMDYGIFLSYSSLGIISWTLLAALLGYFFGEYFDLILSIFKAIGWGSLAVFSLIIVAVYWWRRKKRVAGNG